MKVVIIGGGPGGRAAAMELANLEQDVTLIEKGLIGGTCLNEGCMVVCGLNDVARFLNDAQNFQKMNIINTKWNFKYSDVADGVKETLNKIRHVTEKETLSAGIELIYGEAEVHNGYVSASGQNFKYDKLIIATGGRPFIPPINGAKKAITYKQILDLKEVPEKLIIVGSGVIASEFAGIFSTMGSEVHILCRTDMLGMLDPKIREYVVNNLLKDVIIHRNIETQEIYDNGVLTSEGELEGKVLLATGMVPNSEFVGDLVEKDPRGHILVNSKMETSTKNIYALGDVTGGIGTTPIARMEGIVAAHNVMGIETHANYHYLPQAISLQYDVAFLDNSQTSKAEKIKDSVKSENIVEGHIPGLAGPGSFWRVLSRETGFTKMDVDLDSGYVEKLSSISPSARYNIAYVSLLVRLGRKTYDFQEFVETHPSTDSIYKLMRFFSKY